MPVAVTASGFFGKLPSRGDFVRGGLPRSFTDPWDAWLRDVLPASRAILREVWIPAWLEAPVWRFALPPGVCGPERVLGLWMPSMDRAGRYFPLVLAQTGGGGESLDEAFLSAAEDAGRAAIADDWSPGGLAGRLAGQGGRLEHAQAACSSVIPAAAQRRAGIQGHELRELPLDPGSALRAVRDDGTDPAVAMGGPDTLWWTEGSLRRAACALISAGMPDGAGFARMLDERSVAHADPLPRQRGE